MCTFRAGGGLSCHVTNGSYYKMKAKQTNHPILDIWKNKKVVVFENNTLELYALELSIVQSTFDKKHAYNFLMKSNVACIIHIGARNCYNDNNLFKHHWKSNYGMLQEGVYQQHDGCIALLGMFHNRLNKPFSKTLVSDIYAKRFSQINDRLATCTGLLGVEMYLLGKYIHNGMFPTTNERAESCLAFYLDRMFCFKESVLAWILCAKQLKISKNIYLLIARLVWDARVPLLNG